MDVCTGAPNDEVTALVSKDFVGLVAFVTEDVVVSEGIIIIIVEVLVAL